MIFAGCDRVSELQEIAKRLRDHSPTIADVLEGVNNPSSSSSSSTSSYSRSSLFPAHFATKHSTTPPTNQSRSSKDGHNDLTDKQGVPALSNQNADKDESFAQRKAHTSPSLRPPSTTKQLLALASTADYLTSPGQRGKTLPSTPDPSSSSLSKPSSIGSKRKAGVFPGRPRKFDHNAMETLAEPGVLPHSHYPMSLSGYYPKQDTTSQAYFFNNASRAPQGYGPYPGYPQSSEAEARMSAPPSMMSHHHHHQRYPSGGDERRDERGGGGAGSSSGGGPYFPSSHLQTSPRHHASPYHRPLHQSPHHLSASSASSLPPYPSPHPSPSSKERGQKGDDKKTDEGMSVGDILNKLDSSFSPEKSSGGSAWSSGDRREMAGPKEGSMYDEGLSTSPYYYSQRARSQAGYIDDARRAMYNREYADMPGNIKDIYSAAYENSKGAGSSNAKAEAMPGVYGEDRMSSYPEGRGKDSMNRQFGERLERSTSHEMATGRMLVGREQQRDADGRPNRSMTLDPSMYRREAGQNVYGYGQKEQEFYAKRRDSVGHGPMNSPFFYAGKDRDAPGSSREEASNGKQGSGSDDFQRSRQDLMERRMMMSPEKYHHDNALQHQRHSMMSPQSMRQRMEAADSLRSPAKSSPDFEPQSSTPNASSLYGSTPGKSSSFPPVSERRSSGGSAPHSSWGSPSPSSVFPSRFKQTQDESNPEESRERSGLNKDTAEGQRSPNKSESFSGSKKEFSSPGRSSPSPAPFSQPAFPSPVREQSSKMSPGQRPSLDGDNKDGGSGRSSSVGGGEGRSGSGDNGEDGSLVAKKEVFSDDGGDDNTFQGSRPRSPLCPPSPEASMPYPPHFPHPFFASPTRGGHAGPGRPPFGSPRGPHDPTHPGPGFPFGRDLPGRFPLPGLTPDMALTGAPMPPMPPSGPPFMGHIPCGVGPQEDEEETTKDIYFCHLCNFSCQTKMEFDNHMNIHFEYNCPHCDYTSRTEGRLKRHIKDFHSDDSSRRSMPGRPKVYKCKQCQFSATEKDKFWEHARSHIKEDKLLQCPKCPFVTEYKHHLEYHLRNHFGSKPFKCKKCNYSCVNKSMLNSHMKSHTNVYQYRCSDCTYATKYCHSLKLHLRKYNHKPATVLNQDGSLPVGLNAEASGLSIVAKRGPPRGPRGPRKDKHDPYLNRLFGMSQVPLGVPGMNPMLNGMMPFWPMLPHAGIPGHPSPRSGMLPGIGNLARQMGISGDNGENRGGSGMEMGGGEINENSSEGSSSQMKEEDVACRLCDFVGETTEALCMHFVQVHKDEAREVAKAYGISEASMAESVTRSQAEMMERRRLSEPLAESDSEQGPGDFHRRNSIAGLLSRGSAESLHVQTDQKMDMAKMPPSSWPSSSYGEGGNGGSRLMEMCYPGMESGKQDEESDSGPSGGMDILQQMTLKFGSGALTDKKSSPSRDEERKLSKENMNGSEGREGQAPRSHLKEIPLDLTKPKSVSPPMFSNPSSPKRDDSDEFGDDDEYKRSASADDVKSLSKVTELLMQRHPITDTEESAASGSTSVNEATTILPRKRSRKGKAYKLDTLCLKLQERQANSPLDDEDNDSDMEMNFERFQPLQTAIEDEEQEQKVNSEGDPDANPETETSVEKDDEKPLVLAETSDASDKDNKDKGDDSSDTMDYEETKADDTEVTFDNKEDENNEKGEEVSDKVEEMEAVENEKNEENNIENEEPVKEEKMFTDEAEHELEKLQKSLNILDKGFDPETETLSTDKAENKEEAGDEVQILFQEEKAHDEVSERNKREDENRRESTEEQALSDKENSNDATLLNATSAQRSSDGEGDEVDQVEMINTVLENRKKPLPPAVRRGTELAWKLLNDPVNPVTSLPLPATSPPPPPPRARMSPPFSSSASAMSAIVSNTSPLRNGMKALPIPPHYSSPSHPSVHPHAPQALMSMKPPMPIPLPPTPMAFIPPTNRMIPEPQMMPPAPSMKHPQRELYECTYCDLSFRDCVMYTVHMGYHSNRNPFKCNNCGIVCRDKVEFFLHIARAAHA